MAFFRLIHKVQCRCCNLFILCIHFYVVSYLCVKCTPHWIEKIGNFSMRGYLSLIWKDCSTHVHGLAIYLKEGLPFACKLSVENSADSYLCYLCFQLALLHSLSFFYSLSFFSLHWSLSLSLCTVLDSVSSIIHEVL